MEHIYLPGERIRLLRKGKGDLSGVEKLCKCKIRITADDVVEVSDADAYGEFLAKSVLQAYGRGFDVRTAMLLANDDYYFSSIDIGEVFGNEKRARQVKSRIIGEGGRTKDYIEQVSGVKISVYGDTVSFIGTHSQINEAETAVNTLVEGGTHKLAYLKMEAAHRRNRSSQIGIAP